MLTQEQKQYVKDNYLFETDTELSRKLQVPKHVIATYRRAQDLRKKASRRLRHNRMNMVSFKGEKYLVYKEDITANADDISFIVVVPKPPYYIVRGKVLENLIDELPTNKKEHVSIDMEVVRKIREMYTNGMKIHEIAKILDYKHTIVKDVISNKQYKDDNYKYISHKQKKMNSYIKLIPTEPPKKLIDWVNDPRRKCSRALFLDRLWVGIRGEQIFKEKIVTKIVIAKQEKALTINEIVKDPRCDTIHRETVRKRLKRGADPLQSKRSPAHILVIENEIKTVADWARDPRCEIGKKALFNRKIKNICRCLNLLKKKAHFPCMSCLMRTTSSVENL